MKKFLYLMAVICFSTSVMAQIPTNQTLSGMGEINGSNPVPTGHLQSLQGTNTPKDFATSTNSISNTRMNLPRSSEVSKTASASARDDLFPELGNKKEEEKKDDKDSGMIRLIIDNVTIVNPPLNGISFCVAKITAENKTNVTINQLSILVKYGSLDVPVVFSGVASNGGTQDQSLAFAGQNCNSLLSLPTITVQTCVAGPMTIGECQSKIKYIPIQ